MRSYIKVAVADASYHRQEPLTYATDLDVKRGSIIRVPLRDKEVVGLVLDKSEREKSLHLRDAVGVVCTDSLPEELVKLLVWMKDYYAAPLGLTAQQFIPSNLAATPEESQDNTPFMKPSSNNLPPLNREQREAVRSIVGSGTYLLHGDTGTGKTRVYIELSLKNLQANKSTIILTPEIALTSQLARDFREVFGSRVFILHSQLSTTIRRVLWRKLLSEKRPVIIIGPRSALFVPIRTIGLIVVDEEHETAYKQDRSPHYHINRVATKLAQLHNAIIVLGSATPLVSDYYFAKQKGRPVVEMRETAVTSAISKPRIDIVDLLNQNNHTRNPYLSDILIKSIENSLAKREQVLLFLNRRGTARIVLCDKCGWQALCPHCDLNLIYHGDMHSLVCHSCNYKTQPTNSCPSCQNPQIILKSIGTKAIADYTSSLFPDARVMRFDTDNKKTERIEQHYRTIYEGNIDIIIGTQTLAKGLDLPKLGLVGIIIADTGLYFPDFSAQERTYQLLYQVIGRIGRGHREGRAIIQTYSPNNPILQQVIGNKWLDFYNNEIKERSHFLFPPFCYLLKLTCRRSTAKLAEITSQKFVNKLSQEHLGIIIEGPAPCFHERVNGKYCWQLIIKAKRRGELLKVINCLPSGWDYDIDPTNLL